MVLVLKCGFLGFKMKMNYVYQLLETERDKLLGIIKKCENLEEKAELIGNKNLLEYSIALLKKCEEFDIKPKSIFTKLPVQLCQSPSSEYRIVEDCETEEPKWWVEAKIKGRRFNCVRLHQGDVVIEV
jgi:hypothetical protein